MFFKKSKKAKEEQLSVNNEVKDNQETMIPDAKVEKISVSELNKEEENKLNESLYNLIVAFLNLSKEEKEQAIELIKKGKI